jgi:N-acetyl-D-muramate 6-phosphate phosphatase
MNLESAHRPVQAVFFDLDGTLLDTAPDMTSALNQLRLENDREPLPFDTLRSSVSHGSARLVSVGFPDLEESALPALQQRFLHIYSANLSNGTRLFAGMEEVLDELRFLGLRLGIVTNKPGWLTMPLLEQLQLHGRFACIVSGDTLARRKPHPLPLLHAAQLAQVTPAHCIYVGDAERDIQAARAANMTSLIALYGYIGAEDRPADWNADGDLSQPPDLLPWLRVNRRL